MAFPDCPLEQLPVGGIPGNFGEPFEPMGDRREPDAGRGGGRACRYETGDELAEERRDARTPFRGDGLRGGDHIPVGGKRELGYGKTLRYVEPIFYDTYRRSARQTTLSRALPRRKGASH